MGLEDLIPKLLYLHSNMHKYQTYRAMERIAAKLTRGFSKKGKRQSATVKSHTVHLSSHPQYPVRGIVEKVSWEEEDSNYKPVNFTHAAVLANDRTKKENGWADPEEWTPEFKLEVSQRTSNAIELEGRVIMVDGKPRNPIGRTGMIGRGLLGKFGPNNAADPLVTRFDSDSGRLQMVAIKRTDNGQWAIPGGMVDPGETVSVTLRREFMEEARNVKEEDQKEVVDKLDELFETGGTTVFTGYVDDPRNTDNAWMESVCVHFHITDPLLARSMKLGAGDDAGAVKWLPISDSEPDFKNLYASHRDMVIRALLKEPITFATALRNVAI